MKKEFKLTKEEQKVVIKAFAKAIGATVVFCASTIFAFKEWWNYGDAAGVSFMTHVVDEAGCHDDVCEYLDDECMENPKPEDGGWK